MPWYIFLSLLDVLSLTSHTSVLKATRCLHLYTRLNFPEIGKTTFYSSVFLDCFSVSSIYNHCTIHTINNFDKSFWKLQTRKNCSFAWTVSLIQLSILLNHIFRLQKICMTLMNKILESDYGKEFFNQNTN